MAKVFKGKKLPRGISQRKDDGKFIAGFVDRTGKRHQPRFDTVVEAEKWLEKARYEDRFGDGVFDDDMTVNEWFKFWHASLKTTMDKYVHVTDDSLETGIKLFEQGQLANGLTAEPGEDDAA